MIHEPASAPDPAASNRVLERYWALFDAESSSIDELARRTFRVDARLESDALDAPLVGPAAIAEHLLEVTAGRRPTMRRITDVEWAHRAARWCWASQGPTGTRRGMDVVRLDVDRRSIELVVRFSGLLPPPA